MFGCPEVGVSEDGLSWLEMLLTSLRASEVGVTMSIREGREDREEREERGGEGGEGGEGRRGEERGGEGREEREGKEARMKM